MVKCVDCNNTSDYPKGWYCEYTNLGKHMRCQFCGEKEEKKRIDSLTPTSKKAYEMGMPSMQPERSKPEDSECDFCKGNCKCQLRQKNNITIKKSVKNEEINTEGNVTFIA